jgi:hypothetical protein
MSEEGLQQVDKCGVVMNIAVLFALIFTWLCLAA